MIDLAMTKDDSRSSSKGVTTHLKNITASILKLRSLQQRMETISNQNSPDFGPDGQLEYVAASVLLRKLAETLKSNSDLKEITKILIQAMSIMEKKRAEELTKALVYEEEKMELQQTSLKDKVCAHEIKKLQYHRSNN